MSKPGGRSAQRSAISTSSASLSAVQSLVLTTIGMSPVYWLCSARSQPARAAGVAEAAAATPIIPSSDFISDLLVRVSGEHGALAEQALELPHQAVATVHVEFRVGGAGPWRRRGAGPGTVPGCPLKTSFSPSTLASVSTPSGSVMCRSSWPRSRIRPGHLHADDLGLLLPGVEPAAHHQDGVVLDEGAVLGHRLGEDEDLHGRLQVFEHEPGHEVALLRVRAPEVGDDPAHRHARASGPPPAVSSSRMSERVLSV